jgi:hypothetical protein
MVKPAEPKMRTNLTAWDNRSPINVYWGRSDPAPSLHFNIGYDTMPPELAPGILARLAPW